MRTTKTLSDVVAKAKDYNALGLSVSLSYLPIPAYTTNAVTETVREYDRLLAAIVTHNLNADITVKPQQFGSALGSEVALRALTETAQKAHAQNIHVWLDKELATQVDLMHEAAKQLGPTVTGICFQAFRERSRADITALHSFPMRLVKGFYNDFDISPWSAVTANYSELMDELVLHSPYPCFATHDLTLIEKAKQLLRSNGMRGEIQFFAGVRDELAATLVTEGYPVRIYLPYGRVYAFLWYGLPIFDRVRALKRLLGYEHIS